MKKPLRLFKIEFIWFGRRFEDWSDFFKIYYGRQWAIPCGLFIDIWKLRIILSTVWNNKIMNEG